MEAATRVRDNPLANRLMVIDPARGIAHTAVSELPAWLRAGDLLVVNDAATVPASLHGTFGGAPIELRLAAPTDDPVVWQAVVFGAGDWRTRTEHRPTPPLLAPGDAPSELRRQHQARVAELVHQVPPPLALRRRPLQKPAPHEGREQFEVARPRLVHP